MYRSIEFMYSIRNLTRSHNLAFAQDTYTTLGLVHLFAVIKKVRISFFSFFTACIITLLPTLYLNAYTLPSPYASTLYLTLTNPPFFIPSSKSARSHFVSPSSLGTGTSLKLFYDWLYFTSPFWVGRTLCCRILTGLGVYILLRWAYVLHGLLTRHWMSI